MIYFVSSVESIKEDEMLFYYFISSLFKCHWDHWFWSCLAMIPSFLTVINCSFQHSQINHCSEVQSRSCNQFPGDTGHFNSIWAVEINIIINNDCFLFWYIWTSRKYINISNSVTVYLIKCKKLLLIHSQHKNICILLSVACVAKMDNRFNYIYLLYMYIF